MEAFETNVIINPTINLYCQDCFPAMRKMADNQYDLAIVDPPYGIGVKGENPIKNPADHRVHKYKNRIDWDDNIPSKEYFDELFRISKNQIIWGGNHYLDILGYCKAPIIWDKLNGESLYADGEFAWTSKDMPKNLKIFKHAYIGRYNPEPIKIHPTQKPIALYKWLLKNYAKEDDKILDTHGGSMSIAIACHDYGFDLDLYEIDQDYFEAGKKRFEIHKKRPKSFFKEQELQSKDSKLSKLF